MTTTETICITIATCWLSLMAVATYAIWKTDGRVNVSKSVTVEVGE